MRKTVFVLAATFALSFPALAQSPTPSTPATPPAAAPAVPTETVDREGPRNPEARARWEKFQAACGADLKTHCGAFTSKGDQRRTEMRQCVETHKAKFSGACQASITERDADRAARQDAKGGKHEKPKS